MYRERERVLRPAELGIPNFIRWADNHFNNLHLTILLETHNHSFDNH